MPHSQFPRRTLLGHTMSRHFAWHLMANEFHVRSVKIPGTSFYLIASASRLICICNGGPGQLSSSGGPLEAPVQDHQPRREGEVGSPPACRGAGSWTKQVVASFSSRSSFA